MQEMLLLQKGIHPVLVDLGLFGRGLAHPPMEAPVRALAGGAAVRNLLAART